MPIRQSEKARYPANWKAISAAVRADAGNRCEWCNAPNGETIARGRDGTYMLPGGQVYQADTGECMGLARWSEYPVERMVRIVLTVAHLDHQPENNDRANLAALCQRCHLRYDAANHAKNASATRRGRKAAGDLFSDPVGKEG